MKPRLLLHVCCGVCSAYVPEKLLPDFEVTVYYENSNIYPSKEYELRRDAAKTMADGFGIEFLEADYNPKNWFMTVRGHSLDPERGERCRLCIAYRLDKTMEFAKEKGFEWIATTLSVSRTKNAEQINMIGAELAETHGLEFLGRDWKKQDGEKISQVRAREAGIYRQDYCGCVYSLNSKSRIKN